MKIVHIEGGLGNQMACYAVYVAAKTANPEDEIYIDTYLYDIKEAHSTISMWNGYELNTVFGIDIPDIRTLFTDEEVKMQIERLRQSRFWENGWCYDQAFINMMKDYGIILQSAYGKVGESESTRFDVRSKIKKVFRKYGAGAAKNRLTYELKRQIHALNSRFSDDCGKYLLEHREGNYFYNITLDFMKSPYLHHEIADAVRSGLIFRGEIDAENERYIELIRSCNSVSMHVRRTDYLQFNEDCYRFGYFPKCVKYIKKKVQNPVFFIFSDDTVWCMNNKEALGLMKDDTVYIVDINIGKGSYCDMRLMANCKHNIATKSSFGWWGSFLNRNSDKITCCQMGEYVVTNQF